MGDPIERSVYQLWFGHTYAWKQLLKEKEDKDLDRAIDEIIESERALEED